MTADADRKLAEIRAIYFKATAASIQQDFARAIDLLKSMETVADREKATVYMEGLAEMRREFTRRRKR